MLVFRLLEVPDGVRTARRLNHGNGRPTVVPSLREAAWQCWAASLFWRALRIAVVALAYGATATQAHEEHLTPGPQRL